MPALQNAFSLLGLLDAAVFIQGNGELHVDLGTADLLPTEDVARTGVAHDRAILHRPFGGAAGLKVKDSRKPAWVRR